ncbi:inositol phospholipid synthesis and fat-storage-inducing TM-domain-containing protein [Pterulicium gracile]|uniref:Inositol phospholipid synthesis and fat-storage-inducing TM-domain-containing protein n=1 Tax=Pterulicium gracile TaxID=1884261 RepID=A0A5C3QJS3_9AGAR|nr:inositol phospholipid synthesis and fat-storage-inducing TM-domain-containing protein [Pterula gracilis]
MDPRLTAFLAIILTLSFGTAYSALYGTYLDTSNPLLSHLPHPLHGSHYFASKDNFLNVYFIKKAWAWTSAAFCMLVLSSPETRIGERLSKFFVATASWMLFTSWFFGPPMLERLLVATGGECVLVSPDATSYITVPVEYCNSKALLSPETHPDLFASTTASTQWATARPRLRRGHDVSGHIFLLTMSALFLADQLRSRNWSIRSKGVVSREVASAATVALISIWMFAIYTTGVYFHSPLEKFTGFLIGLASFTLTQVLPGLVNPDGPPAAERTITGVKVQ